ncbi:MAG: NADH-quinone oxidoreductase subunit C [Actinomycetota bacterium]|nr:NADH-quinone oxidoreductase subunit C [Actinomycetota bacterium]
MAEEITPQEEPLETDETVEETVARDLPDDPIMAGLAEPFPNVVFTSFDPFAGSRQYTATVTREELIPFVEAVKDAGFETFIDVCSVDHLNRDPRYDVVINLLSMQHAKRLIVKAGVPGDDPTIQSISAIYAGANFYEREVWDLMGIVFEGHPDLTRIVLPDEWEGHPLRKDYSVGSVPVQFKGSHKSS